MKKRRLLNILSSAVLTVVGTSVLSASCFNNSSIKMDVKSVQAEVNLANVDVEFDSDELLQYSVDVTLVDSSTGQLNTRYNLNLEKKSDKLASFTLRGLKDNTSYEIKEILINNKKISQSFIFKTKEKSATEFVNSFKLVTLKHNRAVIELGLNKQINQNDISKLEIKLNGVVKNISLDHIISSNESKLVFKLEDLSQGKTYSIDQIKINDQLFAIKTDKIQFNTPVVEFGLENISFENEGEYTYLDVIFTHFISSLKPIKLTFVNSSTNQDEIIQFNTQTKSFKVQLNSLKPNTQYTLKEFNIDGTALNLSDFATKLTFTTPAKNSENQPDPNTQTDDFVISAVSTHDITSNSAKITFNFSKFKLSNTANKTFVLNINGAEYTNTNYQPNSNSLTFEISNLESLTTYSVQSLKLNSKTLVLDQNISFTTRSSESNNPQNTPVEQNVTNINFDEVDQDSARVKVYLDNIDQNAIYTLEYHKASEPANVLTLTGTKMSNYVEFPIENLSANTQYTIAKIKNGSTNINIQSGLNKSFTTTPRTIDYLSISSLSVDQITSNRATLHLSISDKTLAKANNNVIEFVLQNSSGAFVTFTKSNYNSENTLDYVLDGLPSSTQFNIYSIKINNNPVDISNSSFIKTFSTLASDSANSQNFAEQDARYLDIFRQTLSEDQSPFTRTLPYVAKHEWQKFEKDELNVNDVSALSEPTSAEYNNYIKSNSSTQNQLAPQESFDNFSTVPVITSAKYTKNYRNFNLKVYIPNSDSAATYKLKIKKDEEISELILNKDNGSQNTYSTSLEVLNSNFSTLVITDLLKNSEIVSDFENKNKTYEMLKIGQYSADFNFTNRVPNRPAFRLEDSISGSRNWGITVKITSKTRTTLPEFYWKVQKKNGDIVSLKLEKKTDSYGITYFANKVAKDEYKTTIGLFYKENEQTYNITNAGPVLLPNESTAPTTTGNVEINRISVNSTNITVHTNTALDSSKTFKLLVKSTNPFQKWSKVISANQTSGQNASFSINDLAKNIKEYIVVGLSYDNEVSKFNLDSKYIFNKQLSLQDVSLNSIKYLKDNATKRFYASADFNFDADHVQAFKNKWFKFTFDTIIPADREEEFYNLNYEKYPEVYVSFEKLNKFDLSKFYDHIKYKLKSVSVVEPYTLKTYFENITIAHPDSTAFVRTFKYNKLNEKLGYASQEFNLRNTSYTEQLATNKTDLSLSDIRNIWLSNINKNIIPFSIENYSSMVQFNKEIFNSSVDAVSDINAKNNKFSLIDEDGNTKAINVMVPRELIRNNVFTYNETNTEAVLTKDLTRFENLDTYSDENIMFTFDFEFEPFYRKFSDKSQLSAQRRNVVSVPVSYKMIKQNSNIDDVAINLISRSHTQSEKYLKTYIQSLYKFSISLENKVLKLVIKPRFEDIKLFNRQGDHYYNLGRSVYIGNTLFYVHWISENAKDPIRFVEKGYSNGNILAGKNETANITNTYSLKSAIEHENEQVVRLFKQNQDKAIESLRKRTFIVDPNFGGTFSMLGKVKPGDNNDYRFYVTTNQHVWDGSWLSITNDLGMVNGYKRKELIGHSIYGSNNTNSRYNSRYVRFRIPEVIDQPSDLNAGNSEPTVVNKDAHFENIKINFDLIVKHTKSEETNDFPNNNKAIGDFIFNNGQNGGLDKEGKRNLSSHADMAIAIMDLAPLMTKFTRENLDSARNGNKSLTSDEKDIMRFFWNWMDLPTIKVSNELENANDYSIYNWYIAAFPLAGTNNKDSYNGRRYREYMIANPIGFSSVSYLTDKPLSNPAINFSTLYMDFNGGASGSPIYDSEGNFAGYGVESEKGNDPHRGYRIGLFLVDTQRRSFFGSGDNPVNTASFYERMRYLSYLYPEQFSESNFNKMPVFKA
ncbi:hypothetical protein [Mycoplasma simbae]|uniref:hypothetical protein n=1 Tax=Mycoplasma simbae TaxID=36744 RepID=UPI0004964195|nr:hypothetical protein [Mycoplasma simbae]